MPKVNKSASDQSSIWVVTTAQFAQMLGVHPRFVRELVQQGMPIVEPGGPGKRGEMLPISALEAFLAETFSGLRRALVGDQPEEIADISARHLALVAERFREAAANPTSLTEFCWNE